jgi:hypothetical protein
MLGKIWTSRFYFTKKWMDRHAYSCGASRRIGSVGGYSISSMEGWAIWLSIATLSNEEISTNLKWFSWTMSRWRPWMLTTMESTPYHSDARDYGHNVSNYVTSRPEPQYRQASRHIPASYNHPSIHHCSASGSYCGSQLFPIFRNREDSGVRWSINTERDV